MQAIPNVTRGHGQQAIERALVALDLADRALLDLSLNRGFPDSRIAALLELDEAAIAGRRETLLDSLAAAADITGADARARVEEVLRRVSDETWLGGSGAGRPPKRLLWIAPVLIAAALAVTIVVFAAGGDGDPVGSVAGEATDQPPPARPAEPPPLPGIALTPVPGAGVDGSVAARLRGSGPRPRLELALRLPEPRGITYVAWLYESPKNALPVAGTLSGEDRLSVRLLRGFEQYPYLDVNAQLPGTLRHSGRSLFRIRLERLAPRPAG